MTFTWKNDLACVFIAQHKPWKSTMWAQGNYSKSTLKQSGAWTCPIIFKSNCISLPFPVTLLLSLVSAISTRNVFHVFLVLLMCLPPLGMKKEKQVWVVILSQNMIYWQVISSCHTWVKVMLESQFIFSDSFSDETPIILMFPQIFMSKRKVSSGCLWTQLRCTAMSHGSVRRQKVFHKYPKLNKIINVTNSYLWGQFPCLSLWEPPLPKLLFFLHETKTVSGYLFVIPNSHVGGLR